MPQMSCPRLIQFRAPEPVADALASAAAEQHETVSSYIRRLILSDVQRRRDPPAPRHAGFDGLQTEEA